MDTFTCYKNYWSHWNDKYYTKISPKILFLLQTKLLEQNKLETFPKNNGCKSVLLNKALQIKYGQQQLYYILKKIKAF